VRRLALLLILVLALAGCFGGGDDSSDRGSASGSGSDAANPNMPTEATKNTTRVDSADPAVSAAAIARATYPGKGPGTVVLADGGDWRGALTASVLSGSPLRAPVLLSDGTDMPDATSDALEALGPGGSADAGGAQVVRVGDVPRPAGLKAVDVTAATAEETARAMDTFASSVAGKPSRTVIVTTSEKPEIAMTAAGWSARSASPILFATRDAVPEVTQLAIQAHDKPRIYLLGGEDVLSKAVEQALGRLGKVTRVSGTDATTTSIAAARLRDGAGGWAVDDPGHGLVFLSSKAPVLAAGAAPLSNSGTYGPPLVLPADGSLPASLREYLLDIQPGYAESPVRGVYNHGWIVGDRTLVPLATQSAIDELLEISPVRTQ
jgi:hypothetical protein